MHNKRQDVAKVELRVPAGGTVHVQDDVAAQLLGTGDFAEGDAPAGLLDAIDAGHAQRFPGEESAAVEISAAEALDKPRKRGASK